MSCAAIILCEHTQSGHMHSLRMDVWRGTWTPLHLVSHFSHWVNWILQRSRNSPFLKSSILLAIRFFIFFTLIPIIRKMLQIRSEIGWADNQTTPIVQYRYTMKQFYNVHFNAFTIRYLRHDFNYSNVGSWSLLFSKYSSLTFSSKPLNPYQMWTWCQLTFTSLSC